MPTIGFEWPDCLLNTANRSVKIISRASEMKKERIYGEDNSPNKR